jgi:hypothetical protein
VGDFYAARARTPGSITHAASLTRDDYGVAYPSNCSIVCPSQLALCDTK